MLVSLTVVMGDCLPLLLPLSPLLKSDLGLPVPSSPVPAGWVGRCVNVTGDWN